MNRLDGGQRYGKTASVSTAEQTMEQNKEIHPYQSKTTLLLLTKASVRTLWKEGERVEPAKTWALS